MNNCLYCAKVTDEIEISAADKVITICADCFDKHCAEPDFEASILKSMGLA